MLAIAHIPLEITIPIDSYTQAIKLYLSKMHIYCSLHCCRALAVVATATDALIFTSFRCCVVNPSEKKKNLLFVLPSV